jgi:DNA polymerase IV
MRWIGHIDSDCFYVSCERIRRPELRGIPVGVMSNQGACVIAKSYELKAAGVTTAMAIWDARPLCPEAVFVKRDFQWYEVVSRQLLDKVRQVSPAVEYYSIDEQFFNADYLEQALGCPVAEAAARLQQTVLQEVGIPVSIGIASTKTIAKLISSSSKPFGYQVIIDQDQARDFYADLPVEKITGIASRSKRKLAGYGITTCGQFANAERSLIRRLLTKSGEELWWELGGTSTRPILTNRPPHKVISRGGSVGRATDDRTILHAWLARNLERLIEALDFHQVNCDELALMLRYKSGLTSGSKLRLPQSTAAFRLLLEAGSQLFAESWTRGRMVRFMHLFAGKLAYRGQTQQSLFDHPTPRDQRLAQVKREINQQVGRFALRSGATLPLFDLYHDEASDHETCDIHGTTCF